VRHVVITGTHQVQVTDAPDPALLAPDGAILSVDATAICGSDLHFYDGDIPVVEPLPVGHEFIGTVIEVGADVRTIRVGDRVLAASVTGCGRCEGCATGDPVTCAFGAQVFGSGALPAGQATAVAVPSADFTLLKIPEGIDDEAALLLTDNLNTGWIAAPARSWPLIRSKGAATAPPHQARHRSSAQPPKPCTTRPMAGGQLP
jgi:threonine dehydrogenase-like Zn-dependent dehydrogenase